MAPRKAPPRRKAPRSFSINAIEAGTAISLAHSANVSGALDSALKGNIKGSLTALEQGIMSNKSKILATMVSAGVGKMLAKSFKVGQVAKLGPLRVRL